MGSSLNVWFNWVRVKGIESGSKMTNVQCLQTCTFEASFQTRSWCDAYARVLACNSLR